MFLPIGIGEIPSPAESQVKLNDDESSIQLCLCQEALLRVQLLLRIENFKVAGSSRRITL